jgi:membrane protein
MSAHPRRVLRTVREFFRHRIWEQDLSRLPWIEAFALRQLRVGIIVAKGCTRGGLALRASAMTFTTLVTLVPLLAIVFSVVRAFGGLSDLEPRLENFVYQNLMPGVQTQIRDWLENFFGDVRGGAFSGLTLIFLLGGALGLLTSIEGAFNDIWGVHRGRSLFSRFSTYTTLVVFGPILVGLSLSMTATLQSSSLLQELIVRSPGLAVLTNYGFKLLPILLTGIALTLLYTFMPNVHVRVRTALPAGMVAAVLWEISKIGYTAYLKNTSHYATLYGSLAAFPLFLLWVYLSWLVVLFGAHLTFAQESADDIREEEMASRVNQTERIRMALHLTLEAARNYKNGVTPPGMVEISRRLGLPLRLVREVAEVLIAGGILSTVIHGRAEGGLVPGRPPEKITVYQVVRCLLNRGHVPLRIRLRAASAAGIVDQILGEMDAGLQSNWANVTLEDCLVREATLHEQDVLPFPLRKLDEQAGGRDL